MQHNRKSEIDSPIEIYDSHCEEFISRKYFLGFIYFILRAYIGMSKLKTTPPLVSLNIINTVPEGTVVKYVV
jgi:hypothetical protein